MGGLACTLYSIEQQHEFVPKSKLPAPFIDGKPPWEIKKHTITLDFGKAERAGEYLRRLFGFAFAIRKDGLIWIPGQYAGEPSAAVLADLQAGITLTFLQHGNVRRLAKDSTTVLHDSEGDGFPSIEAQYRRCSSYKHQQMADEFVDKNSGCLKSGTIKVDGPISPGTVVSHVAFTSSTAAEDPPERMLPLCFALVGCLSLPVNRGVAALLIPEVDDLLEFMVDRPAMTPTAARECQIASAADAALQAQIRLRGKRLAAGAAVPGCYAMTFTPTPWARQQKSRVATIHIPRGDDQVLDRFARALSQLPPRIATRTIKEASGRGKMRTVTEHTEAFRTDSVVRPLVAENLALGRPWYAGFHKLMTKTNPATGKPFRRQLPIERKGLHVMTSDRVMWDQEGEALMVNAIHEAIRQSLGRIREETDGKARKPPSQATKNRWARFREKLRLDLAGAKTGAQLRFALADLFSRGGSNGVLQTDWQKILPIVRKDWQLARDLGLLALASYAGKGATDVDSDIPAESTD
jgi:CRISPR-associated protein Cas8a1/Csx13